MIEFWWMNLKDALAGKQAIGWVSLYNCSSLRSNSASNVWSTICVPLPTLCVHCLTPKSHSLLQELQLITSCLLRSHPTWYFYSTQCTWWSLCCKLGDEMFRCKQRSRQSKHQNKLWLKWLDETLPLCILIKGNSIKKTKSSQKKLQV